MRAGTGRAWGREEMEAVLACPECRGPLDIQLVAEGPGGWEEGGSTCKDCGTTFRLSGGIWDLRGTIVSEEGKDGRRWAAEDFQHLQPSDQEYRSHAEWLQLRLCLSPKAAVTLADYQEPLRKGRLQRWLLDEPWNVTLDVGCGVGYFLFDLLHSVWGERLAIGLDVLPSVLERLVRRCRTERARGMLAVLGNAERLPIRDESVGAVSSSEVLEHVARPGRALSEMARVVQTEGPVVGSTPNARGEALRERAAALAERARLIKRNAESRIYWQELYDVPVTDAWLREHLVGCGLQLEELRYAHTIPGAARIARLLPFRFTSTALLNFDSQLPGKHAGMIMLYKARRRG